MEDSLGKFIARLKAENELDKYKKFETNEENITSTLKFMLKYDFDFKEPYISKNKEKSKNIRAEGNTHHEKANDNTALIDALKLYTKSIAFAPSIELAHAYAARSAILFQLNLYSDCLEDIERALALNYPDHLKAMIYGCKAECLILLRRRFEARDALNELKQWLKKMLNLINLNKLQKLRLQMLKLQSKYAQIQQSVTDDSTKVKESENELPNISSFNAEVPYASDAVAIEYNNNCGRHLIATRDIQPGEIIVVEKPYTLLLNPNQILTHCSNCLKLCWANIPCEHCTYAMYCSRKCRDDEWEKCHYVECNVFPYLIENDCIDHDLHSLRLVVLALKEAENDMEKLKDMVKRLDECKDPRTSNFFQDGKLHCDKYAGVYNLSIPTHIESDDIESEVTLSIFSCIIIYFLATRTDIFGTKLSDLNALVKDKNVIFVGGLILRHQQILCINSFGFYDALGNKYDEIGTAITSFCSLINHSCSPNVWIQSKPEHLIMFAIYPIQKDEQLFVSYGPRFWRTKKNVRQKKLKKFYYFECNCVACQNEWPVSDTDSQLESYTYMILMKNVEDKAKMERILQNLPKYCRLINKGNVDDEPYLINELLEMVQLLHNYAPLPSKEMISIIRLLKYAYTFTDGNRYKLPQKQEN